MKIRLTCVRCGLPLLRSRGAENWRVKVGRAGPFCSRTCTNRLDDPRLTPEPLPVEGARWLRLTRGKFALVDEDVFDRLSTRAWRWNADGESYGHAASGDKESLTFLHHAVLEDSSIVVDHKNNDGLDCRRENLRVADRSKNGANRGKFRGAPGRTFTSRFKGVVNRARHLSPGASPWLARIRVNRALIHVGRYETEHEAAVAYDAAALFHFGDFAKTNFPWDQVNASLSQEQGCSP